MILHRQINAWTTGIELSSGYRSDGLWSAKTVSTDADRYAVVSPDFCSLDVGGQTHRWDTPTTLDLSADASWDFGQDISTWQPNTTYSVGDWVRPTSIADGALNTSTAYATPVMSANTHFSGVTVSLTDAMSPAYYAFNQDTGGASAYNYSILPAQLTISFATPKVVNKFRHYTPSDANARPKNFTFEASNNNSNWTILKTVTNESTSTLAWSPYFTFTNNVAYLYYRFNVSSIYASTQVVIRELHLVAQPQLVYRCTTAGTSHSTEPSWGTTVSGTTTETGGVVWTAYYDDTKAINRAGQDYYIYACQTATTAPKLIASRNSTYPHGYTVSNSRKIGGFHCLCNSVGTISGHDLTGYLTGDILPHSVWCLDHRSDSGSNVGMVYDPKLIKWVGIYLVSGTKTAPTNVYGGTILDTITWYEACDAATLLNMRLPGDAEFQTFAAGSPEAVNIYGSVNPVTVGGYISTGSVRMVSNIGCESCILGIPWLDETSYRFDNTTSANTGYTAVTHTHTVSLSGEAQTATSANSTPSDIAPGWSWKNKTGGKGQIYSQGTYGIVKLGVSGGFNGGTCNGTRGRYLSENPWLTSGHARFITGHISRSI